MAQRAVRLLHITDTHLHDRRDARLRGVDTFATLSRVLSDAAHTTAVHAVLATGDLSQDETAGSYANFRDLLAARDSPVWCLPGNHDAPGQMRAVLTGPQFCVGGVHEAGNWSVILLDSYAAGEHGGRLARDHLDWLAATLHATSAEHVLVAVHHFPLAVGSRWLDELGLHDADDLFAVLDRCPKLRAVVTGHVHQACDLTRSGVRYLATPSTCFQFLPRSDAFAVDVRPPGYRWIDLLDDGKLETRLAWVAAD